MVMREPGPNQALSEGLFNQLLKDRIFREHLSLARFTDDLVSCWSTYSERFCNL